MPNGAEYSYLQMPPRVVCQKCGRSFKYNRTLQAHLNECGKEPKYKCHLCTYRSFYKSNLNRHHASYHNKQ